MPTPTSSPSGDVLMNDPTGRTLVILGMAAVAFLFLLAIAATLRGRNSGMDM
jgi:hypothetical protein